MSFLRPTMRRHPFWVERSQIAGHEPSGRVKRLLRRHLVVGIAEHQAGAAPADLADFADRKLDIGIVLVSRCGFRNLDTTGRRSPRSRSGSSVGNVYWCEHVSVMP